MGMALERIPGTPIVGMVDLFEYIGAEMAGPAARPVIQSGAGLSCRCPNCGGSIRLTKSRHGGGALMTHFGGVDDERALEAEAAAAASAAEAVAQAQASAPAGSCRCPHCGVELRLTLASQPVALPSGGGSMMARRPSAVPARTPPVRAMTKVGDLTLVGAVVAAKRPAGPTIVVRQPPTKGGSSTKPGSKTIYGPAVAIKPNPTIGDHNKIIKGAAQVARRAVVAANAAMKAAATHPRPAALKGAPTKVGGPPPKAMTPKQKAAVAKHQAAVTKSDAAARKAATTGQAAKVAASNLAKAYVKQKDVAAKLRKKPGATRVGEIEAAEIGAALSAYYDYVGAAPDPQNPGYLDDGTVDPAFAAPGLDPAMDPAMLDPAFDPGTGMDTGAALPPPPPRDAVIQNYQDVGGILYDGSKGKKPGCWGSYSYFNKTVVNPNSADRQYGFVFGGDPHNSDWPGNTFNRWVWVHGKKGDAGSIPDFPGQEPGVSGWWDNADSINKSYLDAANVSKASVAKGYGPIIGNPAWPDFAGLRMDQQGNLFWLPQEAPEYVTFPLKQAAALTAQAAAKAAAEALAAEQAAAAKTAADQAAAQAAQDAANALAESAEASAAAVAQSQQATAQAAIDQEQAKIDQQQEAQANAVMMEQAKADAAAAAQERQFALEQARADAEQARQERQILAEAARHEMEMRQARGQSAPPPAQGEEGGGDEGYAEDEGGGGGYDEEYVEDEGVY